MSRAPHGRDPESLADWAEIELLASESPETGLSRSMLLKGLKSEPIEPDDESDDPATEIENPGIDADLAGDVRVDKILREISRRRQIAGGVYSFGVNEGLLYVDEPLWSNVYQYLLVLGQQDAPFRDSDEDTPGDFSDVEEPFDELCLAALKRLGGTGSIGVLFAQRYADDDDPNVRSTAFPEAVRWIRGRLLLSAGQFVPPDSPPADDEGDLPARTYNDGGVDLFVWRPLGDNRPGFPIFMAQCTVQKNWRPKARDIDLELWRDWIRFLTPPTKVLCIPFAVPNRSWWRDRSRVAGLILDRLRLAELLSQMEPDTLGTLSAARSQEWLAEQVSELSS